MIGATTQTVSNRRKEGVARVITFACAALSVFTTFAIVWILFSEALAFFGEVSPVEFFTGTKWEPLGANPKFGVLPLITGTMLITVGSIFISIPLGVLTAVFLSEYASPRFRAVVKPALEFLAGVPTVVYGYLALYLITPVLRDLGMDVRPFNVAAGAIVVGIMTLPLVSSLCEDAISSVPRSLRDGAYGLGATKFEVVRKVVIPAALSGIMASFILAVSRAVGETMAVTLAAGSTPQLTFNPGEEVQTMTAYIVAVSSGDVERGTPQYQNIFAVGATLFVITFALNIGAQAIVKRLGIRGE